MSSKTTPPSVRSDRQPIVIIGGGVIGVCLAHSLAARGASVLVLERGDLGRGASFGNAGTVSPAHPPINAPGRWRELIRSMIDPLSPLYIAPRVDSELFRWFLAFARHCTKRHLRHCRAVMAELARPTPGLHDEIAAVAAERGLDYAYRADGYLEIYRTDAGERIASHEREFAVAQGFRPMRRSGDELRERQPGLSASVRGGYYYESGRTMDPHGFVRAVTRLAEANGAEFRTGVEVEGIVPGGDRSPGGRGDRRGGSRSAAAVRTAAGDIEAGAVVLAAGAYGGRLARDLDVALPIVAAKGYHLDVENGAWGRASRVDEACLLVENSVFCTPLPGRLRLAGTLEFSGVNHDIRRDRLAQLTRAAAPYFADTPADVESGVVSEWVGLRPCTPDGLPAVGSLPGWSNVFASTGHAMLGLTFGPVSGELLARRMLDGEAGPVLRALDPGRFRGWAR